MACLIDATAQVLSEVGLEQLSTNKVAKAAGVAVGSIYQYFPDKEALVRAVVQDRSGRLTQLAVDRMAAVRELSYTQAAETVLRAAVDFFAAEPGVIEVLAPYLAVAPSLPEAHSAVAHVHDLTRDYLSVAAADLDVPDIDLAVYISIGVVSQVAPRIATVTDEATRERLIAEVVRLLARYVGAPEPTV
ncbi:MAG TPA: TetR/AcrR family transcriptional regulator [Acidimicrobiales bacterium]|nr:TetR/AcrR family transcriptional regulator [Acidimicrobiales bacterium]